MTNSSSRADPVVRFHEVSHRYPSGTHALAAVSLEVRRREFVSIIGPSGCGKSTLLRLAAALDHPARGQVERSGTDRTAFVFQQPTLMPWARVERNVALPLELAGTARTDARDRVSRALARVGLEDFAEAYPRELSGGMQMRVSIARALVTEPTLLLMDEPFGALDDITRSRLDDDLLSIWAERDLTVLFVTHSLYEAVFLSTRVLVMSPRPGRIAAELPVGPAGPRSGAFRLTPEYAALCGRLGQLLASVGATG